MYIVIRLYSSKIAIRSYEPRFDWKCDSYTRMWMAKYTKANNKKVIR